MGYEDIIIFVLARPWSEPVLAENLLEIEFQPNLSERCSSGPELGLPCGRGVETCRMSYAVTGGFRQPYCCHGQFSACFAGTLLDPPGR